MPITRAQIETQLIRRAGLWMTTAGLDGTTVAGTNLDLADPIALALYRSGFSILDPTSPTDTDLATLAAGDFFQIVSLAELRLLQNILGNYVKVNVSIGPRSTSYDQFPSRVAERIKVLQSELVTLYGFGAQTLTAGTITLDFVQLDDVDESGE